MNRTHPRKIYWSQKMINLLGTHHDNAIARKITEIFGTEISTSAVQKKRCELKIKAFPIDPFKRRNRWK